MYGGNKSDTSNCKCNLSLLENVGENTHLPELYVNILEHLKYYTSILSLPCTQDKVADHSGSLKTHRKKCASLFSTIPIINTL